LQTPRIATINRSSERAVFAPQRTSVIGKDFEERPAYRLKRPARQLSHARSRNKIGAPHVVGFPNAK
jgi:hypothetical protein